jgi:hypothetical protein
MSAPTRNGPRTRGAASETVRGGRDNGSAPRSWSDAYADLDERAVLAAIAEADIRTLARAADEGAFLRHRGPDGFVCPRGDHRAEVVSAALWWCSGCDRPGTRYELAHAVACDGFACIRLARLVGVLR